jgi:hypothetical protein
MEQILTSAAAAVTAMSIIGRMTFADHVAATQGSPIFGVKNPPAYRSQLGAIRR